LTSDRTGQLVTCTPFTEGRKVRPYRVGVNFPVALPPQRCVHRDLRWPPTRSGRHHAPYARRNSSRRERSMTLVSVAKSPQRAITFANGAEGRNIDIPSASPLNYYQVISAPGDMPK